MRRSYVWFYGALAAVATTCLLLLWVGDYIVAGIDLGIVIGLVIVHVRWERRLRQALRELGTSLEQVEEWERQREKAPWN